MRPLFRLLLVAMCALAVLNASQVLWPIRVCGEHSADPLHLLWLIAFIICSCVGVMDAYKNGTGGFTLVLTLITAVTYAILSFIDGWPMTGTGLLAALLVIGHVVYCYALAHRWPARQYATT